MTREERASIATYRSFSEVIEIGGALVLTIPGVPESPMCNRIVGLGTERPATEADLDAALATLPAGVTFYVGVSPTAEPPALLDWLAARGLEPGWGWRMFRRAPEPPPVATTSLRLTRVETTADATAFGRVVATGYDLPESGVATMAETYERGWECWLARDGDEPVGAAALFVTDGAAYLGLAATLPEHRGKGAQSALLARRIERAAELGCDLVVTETGELRDDRPSNSYRNLQRAGFLEAGVVANWVGTRPS
jgi:GNAT superfamily N-acetyltransferase